MKPIIAITLGDPAGIGPEVVLKSLKDKKIYQVCRPLVIGNAETLTLNNFGSSLKIRPILNPLQAKFELGIVDILHISSLEKTILGQPTRSSGEMSATYVEKSIELALLKIVQGVVHSPISKTAWKLARIPYPGHTEMIASLCNIKKVAMAIVAEPLRTVMVTRHLPLNQVSQKLKIKDIVDSIDLAAQWMKKIKIKNPKIGVCAFNPHAGENGLMGNEELSLISPAIQLARKKTKAEILGPLPADSAFRDHLHKKYDCLITQYHDQSLIPLKLWNASGLINITLGLPFPRTSPGHGTAFDIAGKKQADPLPMIQSILTSAQLVDFYL